MLLYIHTHTTSRERFGINIKGVVCITVYLKKKNPITRVNQNLFMGWRSEWIWVQIHFQPLTGVTLGRLYNLVSLAVNLGY